jgi:flagella basal body P-ring formation protein FlgA
MLRPILLLITILGPLCRAGAVEIVLREHAAPQTAVVRLGDVAEIIADDGTPLQSDLAETPLMPTPAPGTKQFLRSAALRDLLAARSVNMSGLRITGARVVSIGESSPGSEAPTAAPSPTASVENFQSVAEGLTAAIIDYLRQQSGHDLWNVQIEADDDVLAAFQRAGSRAVISGGKAPWTGRQRFSVSGAPGVKGALAYARVERHEMAAFATRAIQRGDLVRRSDVELRTHVGALPAQAVFTLDSIVGKEAVQAIRADALLLNNHVRAPILVHRGEQATVQVRAGGVLVRTYAVAQQDGSLGDVVMVKAVSTKEQYAARVSGLKQLEVFAAGSAASDVAAAAEPVIR